MTVGCTNNDVQMPHPVGTILPAPTEQIQLIEDLRFGHEDSPSAPLFRYVLAIEVDKDGRMYVVDAVDATISVVDSTGHLIGTFGGRGDAPGQFENAPSTWFANGDSITVFSYGKMTIFNQENFLLRGVYRYPEGIHGEQVVFASTGRTFTSQSEIPNSIIQFQLDGQLIEERFKLPKREMLTAADGFINFTPYLSRPACGATPAKIYCGSTRALVFSILSLEGDSIGAISVSYEPTKFTRADRIAFEDQYGKGRYAHDLKFPDYWPAFHLRLVGDDQGRLWVTRLTNDSSETVIWILDAAKEISKEARISGDFWVSAVRDGKLYGTHNSAEGVQSVVRYRIED